MQPGSFRYDVLNQVILHLICSPAQNKKGDGGLHLLSVPDIHRTAELSISYISTTKVWAQGNSSNFLSSQRDLRSGFLACVCAGYLL